MYIYLETQEKKKINTKPLFLFPYVNFLFKLDILVVIFRKCFAVLYVFVLHK